STPIKGKCIARSAAGARCDVSDKSFALCDATLYCKPDEPGVGIGQCAPMVWAALGASCDTDTFCAGGECVRGTCVARLREGDPWRTDRGSIGREGTYCKVESPRSTSGTCPPIPACH